MNVLLLNPQTNLRHAQRSESLADRNGCAELQGGEVSTEAKAAQSFTTFYPMTSGDNGSRIQPVGIQLRSEPLDLSVAGAFDLPEGLLNEPVVVFFGEIPLDELRGDHDRQVHRLDANLLHRARGLELNLTLGTLDDRV